MAAFRGDGFCRGGGRESFDHPAFPEGIGSCRSRPARRRCLYEVKKACDDPCDSARADEILPILIGALTARAVTTPICRKLKTRRVRLPHSASRSNRSFKKIAADNRRR
jgi:hypothetical protein